MSFCLILLAAGNSKRFGSKIPKPFIEIGSKTLLEHSLIKFNQINQINRIIVVINRKHLKFLKKIKFNKFSKVIGGGDWNINRLVPDIFKSIYNNKKLIIRNPGAIRPWQHILEILNVFILILLNKNNITNNTAEIFNVAPNLKSNISVVNLINLIKKIGNYNNLNVQFKKNYLYETKILKLSSNKARKQLNYIPKLTLKETISLTIDWYKCFFQNRKQILKFTQIQIQSYFKK